MSERDTLAPIVEPLPHEMRGRLDIALTRGAGLFVSKVCGRPDLWAKIEPDFGDYVRELFGPPNPQRGRRAR